MFTMNRRVVGIIAATVVVLFIVLSLLPKKNTVPQNENPQRRAPVITVAPLPVVGQYGTPAPGTVFTFVGPTPSLPTELPAYTVSFTDSNTLVTNAYAFAKALGFSGSASTQTPSVYDWTDTNKHFSYNDLSKTLSYGQFTPAGSSSGSLTPDTVLQNLSIFHFLSNGFQYTESGRDTVSGGEGGAASSPVTVISYTATYTGGSFPFILSDNSVRGGEIHIDSVGRLMSFSFYVLPSVTALPPIPTITLQNALLELNNQKALLSWVGSASTGYVPTAPKFTSVAVSSIQPAFFFLSGASRFVPIYVLSGMGSGGGDSQPVRYYLRATN